MDDFAEKTAVVTGAASGIGLAMAQRLAAEGMKVVLADIEEPALEAAVAGLRDAGHDVIGVPTDVSKIEAIEQLAEATLRAFGEVNFVHNNAGVVTSAPIDKLTLDDWNWVLGVDLWSVIYGVKVFLPLIKEAGVGHIVNTASTCGIQATPNIGPYNVAKFGVVALTETLRLELDNEQSPVSASVLCPGAINTGIVRSDRNRAASDEHESSPQEEVFKERSTAMLSEGMPPSEVADIVLRGVRANDFWILTHPEWKNVLERRITSLKADNSLHHSFGG